MNVIEKILKAVAACPQLQRTQEKGRRNREIALRGNQKNRGGSIMDKIFVTLEAARQVICDACARPGCPRLWGNNCDRIDRLIAISAADVVARDCYDRILAENDTMREMLARIGKNCGDSMDDVRPVVRGEWWPAKDGHYGHVMCSGCHKIESHKTDFCPNCGADMRKPRLRRCGLCENEHVRLEQLPNGFWHVVCDRYACDRKVEYYYDNPDEAVYQWNTKNYILE